MPLSVSSLGPEKGGSFYALCPSAKKPSNFCTSVPFHVPFRGYIQENVWHESQKMEEQDDGSIIFEAEVAGTEEIKFWTMSWGSKAQVLEPQSLRGKILAEAQAMQQNYSRMFEELEAPVRA